MLQSLRIRNLAVVEDLSWELESGLNILTGETGAGKSILIDAFNLLLGERSDKGMIRDGAEECVVEGLLVGCAQVNGFLEESGVDAGDDGELLLKRAFHKSKSGKQWVNGSPVTLQILKKLGDALVDLHGPHDHQSLLSVEEQLKALDAFAGQEELRRELGAEFRKWQTTLTALEECRQTDAGALVQRLDFLNYQIEEIETADLKPGEEEELEAEFDRATHQQRILEVFSECQGLLSEGETNVLDQMAQVQRLLTEWERMDPAASTFRETNEGLVSQIGELLRDMEDQSERTETDPERLAELESRLDLIKTLKRKYGSTLEAILEAAETMRQERDDLSGREGRIQELEAEAEAARKRCEDISAKLTKVRKKEAPKLAQSITDQLQFLGFAQAHFEVRLEAREEMRAAGNDRCEFFFAPNPGESPRPLKAVASSGEMARVMLAVKTVLAATDQVPILIFDEVDANVGGETAVAVGKRLRELAGSHQVLCITHLPQVAAAGHVHYRVEKLVEGGRTQARLTELVKDDRLDELSRMLGGKSDSAKKLARTLLEESGS
jgi:DNA repair protein RecN (Recombination protein N)